MKLKREMRRNNKIIQMFKWIHKNMNPDAEIKIRMKTVFS